MVGREEEEMKVEVVEKKWKKVMKGMGLGES